MKKLQSLFTNFRKRLLVADCICALATASVLLVVLTSCSHTRYIPLPESHQRDSLSKSVNLLVNTTYVDRTHTLTQRGDTIFKTDSIYVEKFTDIEVHDTITVTQIDTVSIAVPCPSWGKGAGRRERGYIPRFYRNSTIGFWLLLLALIAFIALRLYLRR